MDVINGFGEVLHRFNDMLFASGRFWLTIEPLRSTVVQHKRAIGKVADVEISFVRPFFGSIFAIDEGINHVAFIFDEDVACDLFPEFGGPRAELTFL